MSSSDDAMRLAGEICTRSVYPRFADFVRQAITNCTLDRIPLDDDQCAALFRAAFNAGDGVFDEIAHTIDHQTIMEFRRSLETDDA